MPNKLLIKVCGNMQSQNLKEVCALKPDCVGFIFYSKSKRFVSNPVEVEQPHGSDAKRVGVFVNATEQEIIQKIAEYNLDYIQLHGDETPDFCARINQIRPVFKAFQINNNFNQININSYLSSCYCFLLDAASNAYGGSGKKFDWSLLKDYKLEKPFILSGGISESDVESINNINHPKMIGIDLNSKFEISPGIKDIAKLSAFLTKLKL